jgi:excisionase family DNA binding protein
VSQESPWTVEEAAAWLRCSTEHIRRLARREQLRGVKFAGKWRFSPADVRALIALPQRGKVEALTKGLGAELAAHMDAVFARRSVRRTP